MRRYALVPKDAVPDGVPPVPSTVPFNQAGVASDALQTIHEALRANMAGGGRFTALCHDMLETAVPSGKALLTTSCTDALELAALALDLGAGDEVIMPSWTFPSTANAFALRGCTPVFVDVTPGTLTIDPAAAAAAITSRTRALLCVHYAGVACDMAALRSLCRAHGLALVEDAAQAYGASWNNEPLGGLGDVGTFSFHATKNISCGEGGALIVTRDDLFAKAEIAWEKGTNRRSFERKQVERYEWCDLGSSFLPSEITAALLSTELARAAILTDLRVAAWNRYVALINHAGVDEALLAGPSAPAYAHHNGHIFAVQLRDQGRRDEVLRVCARRGIDARTHYQPLHSSPAGRRFGRAAGSFAVTDAAATRLIRLPIFADIQASEQERVVEVVVDAIRAADRI